MLLNERIFNLLRVQNKTAKDLGNFINVKPSSISAWKTEGSFPSSKYIIRISEFFNVSLDYLFFGSETTKTIIYKPENYSRLTELDKQLIDSQISMLLSRPEYQEPKQQVIYPLKKLQPAQVNEQTSTYIYRKGQAAAGAPILAIDLHEFYSVHDIKNYPGAFIIQAQGDSMIGDGINDGDFVLFKPTSSTLNGSIALVTTPDNEVTIKHFYKHRDGYSLHSSNDDYMPLIFDKKQPLLVTGEYIKTYKKEDCTPVSL